MPGQIKRVFKRGWRSVATAKACEWISRHQTPLFLKELGWQTIQFVVKCGQSHPISFILRPVAAHGRLRLGLGVALAVLAIAGSVWGPVPSLAQDIGGGLELVVVDPGEVNTKTIPSVQLPLPKVDISQKFWLLHSGLDMRSPIGTPIRPIMTGRVVKVAIERFGYGQHVILEHKNGIESLYAHMSKVLVEDGQEVNNETTLGLVGSTGRSTGPHLHLEIRVEGKIVDPASILGIR